VCGCRAQAVDSKQAAWRGVAVPRAAPAASYAAAARNNATPCAWPLALAARRAARAKRTYELHWELQLVHHAHDGAAARCSVQLCQDEAAQRHGVVKLARLVEHVEACA
jgi:hypothetical protein